MIKKKKKKLKYIPLVYSEDLRSAYTEASVVGNRLVGRNVLVTGGTGGIGLAIAMRFLTEKSNVIISGRNEQRLQTSMAYLKERFPAGNIQTIVLDLCNAESILAVVKQLSQQETFIDILVNNAGICTEESRKRRFRSVSEEEFKNVWNTNFEGTVLLTNEIANAMSERDIKGNIVNIASICAEFRSYQHTPYGISKSALVSYSKILSEKYDDITINVIEPGSVATPMEKLGIGDNIVRNCNVLHHSALPEEIASLVAFLAGGFGKYLTDHAIVASACEKL
ncbi:MAG: SDR family oxidoreductase [Acetatifactor sp.]|nr:SDR family oxidoreductase [Acetatifactor sp.]